MGYLEAYGERLKRNQSELLQLIKDVLEKDSTIEAYVYNDFLKGECHLQGVVFIKGEKINSVHFHEVPYRWSGCGYGEFGKSHSGGDNVSMPFDADDVINNFRPINSIVHRRKAHNSEEAEYFKDKQQYLNWCSYLKQYDNTDSKPTNNSHQ
jgi:hypothetical protein